mmetsp:Transcript_118331/g.346654  ORF Transcript_118331/g.346654 Transcript_118331/m.346654 type:complete len:496 (-) Transcript_118331:113-1600(-)
MNRLPCSWHFRGSAGALKPRPCLLLPGILRLDNCRHIRVGRLGDLARTEKPLSGLDDPLAPEAHLELAWSLLAITLTKLPGTIILLDDLQRRVEFDEAGLLALLPRTLCHCVRCCALHGRGSLCWKSLKWGGGSLLCLRCHFSGLPLSLGCCILVFIQVRDCWGRLLAEPLLPAVPRHAVACIGFPVRTVPVPVQCAPKFEVADEHSPLIMPLAPENLALPVALLFKLDAVLVCRPHVVNAIEPLLTGTLHLHPCRQWALRIGGWTVFANSVLTKLCLQLLQGLLIAALPLLLDLLGALYGRGRLSLRLGRPFAARRGAEGEPSPGARSGLRCGRSCRGSVCLDLGLACFGPLLRRLRQRRRERGDQLPSILGRGAPLVLRELRDELAHCQALGEVGGHVSGVVLDVRIGAALEQQPHDGGPAVERGAVQRRPPILRRVVWIRRRPQELPNHDRVPGDGGLGEGGVAGPVDGLDVGTLLEQALDISVPAGKGTFQ